MATKSQIALRLIAKELRSFKNVVTTLVKDVVELKKFAGTFWKEDLQKETDEKRFKKNVQNDLTELKKMVSELKISVEDRFKVYDDQIDRQGQRIRELEQARRASGT